MATVSLWSGVQIAVQSALATALPISAISKANPGVVSYTGTDPSDGNFLYLSDILGMYQVDDRIFRADDTDGGANTTELEGENTTNYDTFVSGNAQVITFGTTLQIVTDLQASGGDFNKIDTTTIHDLVRKEIPGAANPISYSGSCIWDPADAGFAALKAAADNKEKRAIKLTFANGRICVFTGYIGFTGLPTGTAQDKVVTPFSIDMFGRPTYYTS
jgi:hypothetical protein